MAVHTKLTKAEIINHLTKYSSEKLGELLDYQEIIEGIDNSNFLIITTNGKFILTVFESRIDKNLLPFFVNFKLHLASKKIFCPQPILDKSGAAIVSLTGNQSEKKSVIVSFLKGSTLKQNAIGAYETITANHCFEVGKTLAKLHNAALDFDMRRENDLGINGWKSLFSKFESLLDNYQKNLREEIIQNLEFLQNSWRSDLPSAVTHLDLFPDNVFFDEEKKVSGVIDFYFAAEDALIFDFAVVVNAWCFDWNFNFVEENFTELLRGYETLRKCSDEEKNFLKFALLGAAMRFLLTRLHDLFFTPKDSLIKIKNPQEYLKKLRYFRLKI